MARTVLLADDSVTAQNMGRRILMDAGYEVVTVNNGSAALKKIHENKPDLIVLDVYMPGYGGLEVCQRLKENVETMKIPVLLTVGKMEPFKTDEAKRVQADAHIVKPFDASELLAALTKLEDRIVPQAEPGKRGKPAAKKARSWHASENPAAAFDDASTEQIAYLAEVKKRQAEHSNLETDEPGAAAATAGKVGATDPRPEMKYVEAPSAEPKEAATFASIVRPMGVPEFTPEPGPEFTPEPGPAFAAEHGPTPEPAAEFAVESEQSGPEEQPEAFTAEPQIAAEPQVAESELEQDFVANSARSFSEAEESVEVSVSSDVPLTPELPVVSAEESKSRWIAENVALTPEEAALELDREMREAQCAAVQKNDTAVHAHEAVSAAADSNIAAEDAIAKDIPAREESLEAPSGPSHDNSNAAAFAAAASASISAVSEAVTSPASASADTSAEPAVDNAAAWKNWQHIRDSVMSPQATAALAESVAEIAQAVAPAEATEVAAGSVPHEQIPEAIAPSVSEEKIAAESAETPVQTSSDSSLENEALASLVDSVLAELKPKLMQEIARKLKK